MKIIYLLSNRMLALAAVVFLSTSLSTANADAPCGDFGECKVLIEINASDGDIGFHFLMDGTDLRRAKLYNPRWKKIFSYFTKRELREQYLTETFAESAEPLCWEDPDALAEAAAEGEELEIVTLEEFLDRWMEGYYRFIGISDGWEISYGKTTLGFDLPAAPADLDFDGSVVSWAGGDDLGECADNTELTEFVSDGLLTIHPEDVVPVSFEVVLEPDVDDGDPSQGLKFTVRVPADTFSVTVPQDYLDSLPDDTPAKFEVGAIGAGDNATFTEEDGICINETNGCD